jgi:hypothetical protein
MDDWTVLIFDVSEDGLPEFNGTGIYTEAWLKFIRLAFLGLVEIYFVVMIRRQVVTVVTDLEISTKTVGPNSSKNVALSSHGHNHTAELDTEGVVKKLNLNKDLLGAAPLKATASERGGSGGPPSHDGEVGKVRKEAAISSPEEGGSYHSTKNSNKENDNLRVIQTPHSPAGIKSSPAAAKRDTAIGHGNKITPQPSSDSGLSRKGSTTDSSVKNTRKGSANLQDKNSSPHPTALSVMKRPSTIVTGSGDVLTPLPPSLSPKPSMLNLISGSHSRSSLGARLSVMQTSASKLQEYKKQLGMKLFHLSSLMTTSGVTMIVAAILLVCQGLNSSWQASINDPYIMASWYLIPYLLLQVSCIMEVLSVEEMLRKLEVR